MRIAIATGPLPIDLERAARSSGADVTRIAPPRALVLAWRAARKAARGSVPAKMAARKLFERAWGAYAATYIARARPDVVIADLPAAEALSRSRHADVLVLARGTADALHAALDAEAERSPELRAHLTNFRASADACGAERRLVANAGRVIALSSWIARSALDAGAHDVHVVESPLSPRAVDAASPRRHDVDPDHLRVLVAGVLIGRHGARPMLEAARARARHLEVVLSGRVADDRAAIARYAGHFRVSDAPSLEGALERADVLVAPWVIDGRSAEVDVALHRGVPVVATEAAGVDETTEGAMRIEAGSTDALLDALDALRDPDRRAALAAATAVSRARRSSDATVERLARALVIDGRGPPS